MFILFFDTPINLYMMNPKSDIYSVRMKLIKNITLYFSLKKYEKIYVKNSPYTINRACYIWFNFCMDRVNFTKLRPSGSHILESTGNISTNKIRSKKYNRDMKHSCNRVGNGSYYFIHW